ncbi:MAG: class I SAM-dependent methyltransferase [Pelagibacterales bacterium]|nr:class I SAM-dependent methyltransferase [Pelagibacterales bacterium]
MKSGSKESEIINELKKLGYWNNLYTKEDYFGTGPTLLAIFAKKIIEDNSLHSILELGCGQGRDAVFFSRLGYNIVATDISKNAIDFVSKVKKEEKLDNLELLVHDTQKVLNVGNSKFDLIYSNLALQFFNIVELEKIFSNIHKLMENNSYFLFSTKKSGDKYYNFGNKISDNAFEYKEIVRYFFEKHELESILKKKFQIISFDESTHVNPDSTKSVWWKILVKKQL